jgi:hypothetical protein
MRRQIALQRHSQTDGVQQIRLILAASQIPVVIDYLWGRPTELLLKALAKTFNPNAGRFAW